jgi:hypothetical protein
MLTKTKELTREQIPGDALLNRNGKQEGPYAVERINEFLRTGEVQESDWVWAEGWPDWKQLSSLVTSGPPPLPPVTRAGAAIGDKLHPRSQSAKPRWYLSSIFIGLVLLLVIILCAAPAFFSNSGLPHWQKDSDLPEDPTGHEVKSGMFKIIQIISPGRALASKYAYQYGMSLPGDQVFLLRGVPTTLVDDETWSGKYFEADTVTYTTTANVEKTVRSYIVVDPVAEQAAAQRQAEAEQGEQAAEQEKEFVNDLSQARDALSTTNLNDAKNLLAEASQLKPDDKRLSDLKIQLKKTQFAVIEK